jgi:hypothetical protein
MGKRKTLFDRAIERAQGAIAEQERFIAWLREQEGEKPKRERKPKAPKPHVVGQDKLA